MKPSGVPAASTAARVALLAPSPSPPPSRSSSIRCGVSVRSSVCVPSSCAYGTPDWSPGASGGLRHSRRCIESATPGDSSALHASPPAGAACAAACDFGGSRRMKV